MSNLSMNLFFAQKLWSKEDDTKAIKISLKKPNLIFLQFNPKSSFLSIFLIKNMFQINFMLKIMEVTASSKY